MIRFVSYSSTHSQNRTWDQYSGPVTAAEPREAHWAYMCVSRHCRNTNAHHHHIAPKEVWRGLHCSVLVIEFSWCTLFIDTNVSMRLWMMLAVATLANGTNQAPLSLQGLQLANGNLLYYYY